MNEVFGYLAGQAVLLVGLAATVGILAGRFAPPHRPSWTLDNAWVTADEAQTAVEERDGRLRASRAEIRQLRAALVDVSDRKDIEMGRLETGAIEAIESTIAAHRERIRGLENMLYAAESTARHYEFQLAEERQRTRRLQDTLAERDALIARHVGRLDAAP